MNIDSDAVMAVEVERLGEGMRYTTRLLAERASTDAAAPRLASEAPGVDTPR